MSLTKASYSMIKGTPFNVVDFGAVGDGNYATGTGTDNTASFIAALSQLSTSGGTALYIPAGIYKVSSQLAIPDAVSIIGDGPWSSIIFCPNAFSNATGLLKIGGTASGYPTQISGIAVIAETGGCSGAGIVSNKNGVFINDVWVSSFNLGVEFNQTDNFMSNFVVEICTLGIRITQSDVELSNGNLYDCIDGVSISNGAAVGSGSVSLTGIRATSCLFSGFAVDAGKSVQLIGCSANHDNTSKNVTAGLLINASTRVSVDGFQGLITTGQHTTGIGIKVVSSTNVAISGGVLERWFDGIQISGTTSSNISIAGAVSTYNYRHGINIQGGDRITVTGCQASFNGSASGNDSGIVSNNTDASRVHIIVGNVCTQAGGGPQEYGINANVTNVLSTTAIIGNYFFFNNTADINLTGQTQNILIANNIFDSFTDVVATIASANTISIPPGANVFVVTGTNNIATINTFSSTRKTITLIFDDALTVLDGVSNLKLAGNFTTTADDTLTLYCDGTNWFEICRSVN